jgi:hypothetical protein
MNKTIIAALWPYSNYAFFQVHPELKDGNSKIIFVRFPEDLDKLRGIRDVQYIISDNLFGIIPEVRHAFVERVKTANFIPY